MTTTINELTAAFVGALIGASAVQLFDAGGQNMTDLLPAAATLIAAYLGARFAFSLEENRQLARKRATEKAGTNRAIYTLFNAWNVLFQLQREAVEPVRSKPDAWLNMQAQIQGQFESLEFPSEDLLFLLDADHANLYAEYLLQEQRYRILMGLVKERSQLVLEKLHPKMDELGYGPATPLNLTKVEGQLGHDLTNKLKQLTAAIIRNIDEDVEALENIYYKMRDAMKPYFDGDKLLEVRFERMEIGSAIGIKYFDNDVKKLEGKIAGVTDSFVPSEVKKLVKTAPKDAVEAAWHHMESSATAAASASSGTPFYKIPEMLRQNNMLTKDEAEALYRLYVLRNEAATEKEGFVTDVSSGSYSSAIFTLDEKLKKKT